jgi:UDP-glucose 4-epimerase
MKSLVTGGAGFIGSNLVDKLLDLGHEVVVIDNEYSDAHDKFYWNDKAQNYKYDIRDYEKTRPLYDGVDYVFHLAAEARIQPAILNPIEAVSINTLGTCVVLQCARESGVKRVVYSSTSSAYGNLPIRHYPGINGHNEEQGEDCLNPYSCSKVSGEKLCKMYTDIYGLQTIILRYFNVYGERQPLKGQYAPVIGLFLKQKSLGQPLTIVGDGTQKRDFTYVGDVVNANILAATKTVNDYSYGQVYNIGTCKNYSINFIADLISKDQINIPPRIGETQVSLSNSRKFLSIFNWNTNTSVSKWILKQVNSEHD